MRQAHIVILVVLGLAAGGAGLGAQILEGDLIVTMQWASFTLQVRPSTGGLITLATAPTGAQHTYAQMAANNQDIVYCVNAYASGVTAMVNLEPNGRQTTLATSATLHPRGHELDYDGKWIIPGGGSTTGLWSMDDATGKLVTLFRGNAAGSFTEMCIDRDPLAPPYVLAAYPSHLLGCDRNGVVSTIIASLPTVHGVELVPMTGDYLVTSQASPAVALVSKVGTIQTLNLSITLPSAARFDRDGTVWVTGNGSPAVLHRIDMTGAVISMLPLVAGARAVGIEIYGSRKLLCTGSGRPGTTVSVALQSHRLGDGNKPYLLGASFLRHPGLRMPNREWLHLTPDNLFNLSTSGLAPGLFVGFRGITDPFGAAHASVVIPPALPSGLRIPIFVAGVIFDTHRIRTVTNTHWFVLN